MVHRIKFAVFGIIFCTIWMVTGVGYAQNKMDESGIDICQQIQEKENLLESEDCKDLKKVSEAQLNGYGAAPDALSLTYDEIPGGALSTAKELVLMGKQQSPEDIDKPPFEENTFRELGVLLDLCRKRNCEEQAQICKKASECYVVILERQWRLGHVMPPFQQALEDAQKNCFLCKLGCMFIGGAKTVLDNAGSELTTRALKVLGIAFLFWIALVLLHLFGTWGVGGERNFLGALFRRILVVGLVAVILSSGTEVVFTYGLAPLVDITTSLSEKVIERGVEGIKNSSNLPQALADQIGLMPVKEGYCPACSGQNSCSLGSGGSVSGESIGLGTKSMNRMICMVCRISRSLTPYKVLGQQLLGEVKLSDKSVEETFDLWGLQLAVPRPFDAFLLGCAFFFVFMYIEFVLGFKVIHIIFNFTIIAVLMPFFVLFYAFPLTRQYTKKGWELFTSTLFEIFGLALAVLFIQILLLGVISIPGMLEDLAEQMQSGSVLNLDTITDILTKGGDITNAFIITIGLIFIATVVHLVIEDIAALIRILTQVNFPDTSTSAMDAASKLVKNVIRPMMGSGKGK